MNLSLRPLFGALAVGWTLLSPALLPTAGWAETKPVVAASIAPLFDWAKTLAGERAQVVLVVPPGASPHAFEPRPSEVRLLARARVFFANGLGLEGWAEKLVQAANPAVRVVRLAEGLGPQGTAEGAPNPHLWLDPVRAQSMVRRMAAALAEVDPEGAADYRSRAEGYLQKLRQLDREFRVATSRFPARRAATFHDAFRYLFGRYGLEVAAVLEPFPGKVPTPSLLKEVVRKLRALRVRVIFAEPQLSPAAAEAVAREVEGAVETLDPLGGPGVPGRESYLELMRFNLAQLRRALGPGSP
ncbi:MAG: metal ABC transporter substrate-binding protein [Nitrospinota bacterium]